jgi:hypothetical protein
MNLILVICVLSVVVANKLKNVQFLCKRCFDSTGMDREGAGLSPVKKFS